MRIHTREPDGAPKMSVQPSFMIADNWARAKGVVLG